MANDPKKRKVCPICDTEHAVGEACPTCEWDEEGETRRAKGELERERIREGLKNPKGGKKKASGGFWS